MTIFYLMLFHDCGNPEFVRKKLVISIRLLPYFGMCFPVHPD